MPVAYTSGGVAFVNEVTGLAGTSRNSFVNALRDDYLPAWDDHVHTKTILGGLIAKKKGTMSGTRALGMVMDVYPASAGFGIGEGDSWLSPQGSRQFNPTLFSRHIGSRLRWTLQVQNAARQGDKGAWMAPKKAEMDAARKQFEIQFDRMMFQGPVQALAELKANEAGTGIYSVYGRDQRTSALADTYKLGATHLRVGMAVATIDAASSTVPAPLGSHFEARNSYGASGIERVIQSVDNTATDPLITIGRTVTGSAADFTLDPTTAVNGALLVPYNSRLGSLGGSDTAGYDSNFMGPNGLRNLIATVSRKAYVYGLSRTTYPTLSGIEDEASGTPRAFSERLIELAADRISEDGTGDDPDVIIAHSSVRREYVRETTGDRRFGEIQQKKGYKNLMFTAGDAELPIKTTKYCPPGLMFILDTSSFGWFSESDLQMIDDGPRFVADQAASEIMLAKSGNEACTKPHNNAIVDDIIYSTTALTA